MAVEPFQISIDVPNHNGQRVALINIQAPSAQLLSERLADAEAMFPAIAGAITHRARANAGHDTAQPAVTVDHVTAGTAKCPEHGKARDGKFGRYCPAKIDAENFCQWRDERRNAS